MKMTVRLRDVAEKKNINQTKLAEKAGISHTTVNRYWLGKNVSEVKLDVLVKLALALNCNPLEFLHVED